VVKSGGVVVPLIVKGTEPMMLFTVARMILCATLIVPDCSVVLCWVVLFH
jgi:hypothetical protein